MTVLQTTNLVLGKVKSLPEVPLKVVELGFKFSLADSKTTSFNVC